MKKSTLYIITFLTILIFFLVSFNVILHIEEYCPRIKKDLYNDILNNNIQAQEHYFNTYIAHGKTLYNENTDDFLNMNYVSGYKTTDNGLYLYTIDGNGYYLEF